MSFSFTAEETFERASFLLARPKASKGYIVIMQTAHIFFQRTHGGQNNLTESEPTLYDLHPMMQKLLNLRGSQKQTKIKPPTDVQEDNSSDGIVYVARRGKNTASTPNSVNNVITTPNCQTLEAKHMHLEER